MKTITFSLHELAILFYSFGNDVRLLHLYASGQDFIPYHEKLNEFYDFLFDSYDTIAELAIAHKEPVDNPSFIQNPIFGPLSVKDFTSKDICDTVIKRGNELLDCIECLDEYESFVQSEIDDIAGQLDKYVNYIFTRCNT